MALISDLKQQYQNEWLAIRVLKEGISGPEDGELLYHAKDVHALWSKLKGDKRNVYVTYAGSAIEEGYAAAF